MTGNKNGRYTDSKIIESAKWYQVTGDYTILHFLIILLSVINLYSPFWQAINENSPTKDIPNYQIKLVTTSTENNELDIIKIAGNKLTCMIKRKNWIISEDVIECDAYFWSLKDGKRM